MPGRKPTIESPPDDTTDVPRTGQRKPPIFTGLGRRAKRTKPTPKKNAKGKNKVVRGRAKAGERLGKKKVKRKRG